MALTVLENRQVFCNVCNIRKSDIELERATSCYQIVWIPAAWRLRSRVTSGRPRCRAVAAMMQSGMSGTTSRGMDLSALATPDHRAAQTLLLMIRWVGED